MLSFSLIQSVIAPAVIFFESWRDLAGRIWHYLNDKYYIGNIPFKITAIVEGALIFAVALLVSRTLSTLLQRRIAKRAYLDPGLRYTMGRLTQYLIIARPVRVGDRITIGEDEGDVQSINLRTTVVATNDRISIIVPNSKLVSQRLINWSYGDPRARISIPVSVAYSSDIDLVTRTLLEAAEEVDNVLRDPSPKVQFLKCGDWALDFRLLF